MIRNLLLTMMCLLLSFPAFPQRGWGGQNAYGPRDTGNQFAEPVYKQLALITNHPDSMRVFFYIKINHDRLQYVVDTDSTSRARYETTTIIRNEDDEIIDSQLRSGELFRQTNSPNDSKNRFHIETVQFLLAKGRYKLFIEIFDKETKQHQRLNKQIEIEMALEETFTLTPILFARQKPSMGITAEHIKPLFPATRLQDDSSLVALFYILSDGRLDHAEVTHRLFKAVSDTVLIDHIQIPIHARIQPVMIHLDSHLEFGKHTLEIEVSGGSLVQKVRNTFYVRWGSHPAFLPDLNLAIRSLVYVTNESILSEVLKKPKEEQAAWLDKFWRERDPDPETEYNGLEDEYYHRVTMTNQRFSTMDGSTIGWQSDRGRIFIIYGIPSDIDHPRIEYGQTTRYEVWYYRSLQRRFVFVDRYGMGDYRLISRQ